MEIERKFLPDPDLLPFRPEIIPYTRSNRDICALHLLCGSAGIMTTISSPINQKE